MESKTNLNGKLNKNYKFFPDSNNYSEADSLETYVKETYEKHVKKNWKKRQAKKMLKKSYHTYKGLLFRERQALGFDLLGMIFGAAIFDKLACESFARKIFKEKDLEN